MSAGLHSHQVTWEKSTSTLELFVELISYGFRVEISDISFFLFHYLCLKILFF